MHMVGVWAFDPRLMICYNYIGTVRYQRHHHEHS